MYIPWYIKSEIKHKTQNKKELDADENLEEHLEKIAHSLIALYYGQKLTKQIDLHNILGFVGNSLMVTPYKSYGIILLLGYYIESFAHKHGNIGLISLILFYYYQLK